MLGTRNVLRTGMPTYRGHESALRMWILLPSSAIRRRERTDVLLACLGTDCEDEIILTHMTFRNGCSRKFMPFPLCVTTCMLCDTTMRGNKMKNSTYRWLLQAQALQTHYAFQLSSARWSQAWSEPIEIRFRTHKLYSPWMRHQFCAFHYWCFIPADTDYRATFPIHSCTNDCQENERMTAIKKVRCDERSSCRGVRTLKSVGIPSAGESMTGTRKGQTWVLANSRTWSLISESRWNSAKEIWLNYGATMVRRGIQSYGMCLPKSLLGLHLYTNMELCTWMWNLKIFTREYSHLGISWHFGLCHCIGDISRLCHLVTYKAIHPWSLLRAVQYNKRDV